ncbi:hypothetical protein VSU19_14455 [Verrucomicrobiales bacterium BCK34]|nr:hypothetical protein [Verrucomicrobiales bacterium BCK34]
MIKNLVLVVISVAALVLAVTAFVVHPPIEGYWRSSDFNCMCGHKNLLHFDDGRATFYHTGHEDIPIKLGTYSWDSTQSYVVTTKYPEVKFYPGWIQYRSEDLKGTTGIGYRELRPWSINEVRSFFAPPTPYDKERRHVSWDSDKVIGRPLKVLMLGEFVLEGEHTFPESFDIEDAVIAAGGFTDLAKNRLGIVGNSDSFYEIDMNSSQNGLTFKPIEGSSPLPSLKDVMRIYIWEDSSSQPPAKWKEWSRTESERRKTPTKGPFPAK